MITDNIKALCKINDKPIGELEKDLGHSKGYLTQIKDRIRWNEILYICKIFDVSVTDLQENDYTKVLKDKIKQEKIAKLKAELEVLEND